MVLRPLTQLPPDADVLFVPDELVHAAQAEAPGARVMPLALSAPHQPAFDDIVNRPLVREFPDRHSR